MHEQQTSRVNGVAAGNLPGLLLDGPETRTEQPQMTLPINASEFTQILQQLEILKPQYSENQQQSNSSFSEVKVPEVSVNEYNNTFNQLNTATKDLVRKLPFLAPFQTMGELKQLVILACCSRLQEIVLANNPQQPKFVLELGTMKRALVHIDDANNKFAAIPADQKERMANLLATFRTQQQQLISQHNRMTNTNDMQLQEQSPQHRPQPQPATRPHTAPSSSLANREKPRAALTLTNTRTASTPPAQAAIPVASAVTPNHVASPLSTPKSPIVGPNPRRPKRKASAVKTIPLHVALVESTSTPAAASTSALASLPVAALVATDGTNSALMDARQKRRREEELATPVRQPSRSKRVRTGWEASSSTETVKKEEWQNVTSLEDSLKYLQEKQDEYRAIVSNSPPDESLHNALLELNKLFSSDGSDINFDLQPVESANDDTLQTSSTTSTLMRPGDPGSLAPPAPEFSHSTNPSPASVGGSSDDEHGGPSISTYHSDSSVAIMDSELASTSDLDDIFQASMLSPLKALAEREALQDCQFFSRNS